MVPLKMPSSTTSLTLEEQTFLSSSVREREKKAQTESLLNTLTLKTKSKSWVSLYVVKINKSESSFRLWIGCLNTKPRAKQNKKENATRGKEMKDETKKNNNKLMRQKIPKLSHIHLKWNEENKNEETKAGIF